MRSKNLLLSLLVTFLAFTFSVEAGTDGRALNLDWIEVGPDNIGGRIQAIQFDNQDATGKTFFIGAITGGIWKTTTGGLTWDKINTENQNVFATSFVQNAAGTVFVGTGLKGKYVGQGLLKSTDGNNFSLIASTDPQLDDNSDWAFINDVKLSSDGNIYVATNTGLMFSDNEGESWTKASLGIENLIGVCDNVEISSNGTVYTSFDGKAYVSAGGIDAFVLVSDDANELLLPDYDCEMFKFSASTVEADVAYALVINDDGELKGAYKTVDNGASWTIIVPGGGTQFAPFAGGTGFDASYILADPFDSDKVYLCGNKVYVGTKPFDDGYYGWDLAFFSGMMTMGVHQAVLDPNSQYRTYYATDFGVVSHNRIGGLVTTYNSHLNISSFNSVAEGINDKVLGGENTYGTLSFDVSGNTELNAGLIRGGKAGYTEMSVINPEIMILSGIEIDIQRTNDMGLSYSNEFIGEELGTNNNAEFTPFALWESFNDVNTKDSLYYHATEDMAANTVVIMRSNNNGYPFEYTLTEDLNNGDSVLVMDKIGAKFFVAIKDAVWMTEDVINLSKSPEWWEISDIDGIPSSIAYSTDGNYVFVGTEEGGVYRISNIVEAYDFLTADIENETSVIATDLVYQIEDRVITSIAIDPNDAEHVVFTCGDYGNDNYVFESNNAIGDTPEFTSIQNNLPKAPVFSSIIEMHNSGRVILGTEYGIFTKDGNSWVQENDEMGAVPVTQIQQQTLTSQTQTIANAVDPETGEIIYKTYKGIENNGVLYISTFGRGLWKSKNYVGIDEPIISNGNSEMSSVNVYPNPVSDFANIVIDAKYGDNVLVSVYDISGRVILTKKINSVSNGEQKVTLNVSDFNEGIYLLQVKNGGSVINGKFTVVR